MIFNAKYLFLRTKCFGRFWKNLQFDSFAGLHSYYQQSSTSEIKALKDCSWNEYLNEEKEVMVEEISEYVELYLYFVAYYEKLLQK